MAIAAVATGPADLRSRLGAITVANTFDGEPVTAEQLGAAGSMAALLQDALKPNLVQTLEGEPALVHCGPFANIAHGNNSIVADLLALKLGDYVVTESGFGADMGFEKLVDIVARRGGFAPSAVILVATTKALKHHGGDPDGGLSALERGAANLAAHMRIVRAVGLDPVVAVNRFPGDSTSELDAAYRLALDLGARAVAVNDGFEQGGSGALALAEAVVEAASAQSQLRSCTTSTTRSRRRSRRSPCRPTALRRSPSARRPGPRRTRFALGAWTASRSAWPRRTSPSPTIRP
jgi:formyltetrahydrofolate synthetase